jgi:hypothetical protein
VRGGHAPGGNVPYGFKRSGKELVRDDAEAAVVRTVFDLAGQGFSSSRIARVLNDSGCVRRNGKAWTSRQAGALLHRPTLYRDGIVHYGEVTGQNTALVLLD